MQDPKNEPMRKFNQYVKINQNLSNLDYHNNINYIKFIQLYHFF
jgi:hypothetical protein